MKTRWWIVGFFLYSTVMCGCHRIPEIKQSNAQGAESEIQITDDNSQVIFQANLVVDEQKILDSFKNATRYQIQLKIEGDLNSLSGHQEVFYTNLETAALDQVYFELIPNSGGDYLKVENITVNNLPVDGSLVFQDSALKVDLAEPLLPGGSIKISMDFLETVPETMGGNYGIFIFQENILALDSFFPIIPVYDDEGWNVQDPPRNADMIYTDAAFFEVQVNAPDDLLLVASGVAVNVKNEKSRQIVTFAGGPQRDFYLAASPGYQSDSQKSGEVTITSFYPKEFKESGQLVLETAVKALRVFSQRYGPYPYTELDLASTPMQAGGMEYSGVAAMALGLYGPGKTASGSPNTVFLEYATAHEVAHQWFFNQVMNDQLEEPWLDEGFAQYLTYIYFLDTYGSTAADQVRSSWEQYWSRVDMEPIPIGKPASEYAPNQYTAIIYGRAPLFILEMENKMGSEVFTRFLADYIKAYQWKTVNTQQFKSLAEESCHCDLTGLFDDWWAVK